jgi:hypothetical protein
MVAGGFLVSLVPRALWIGGMRQLTMLNYFVALDGGRVVGTTGLYTVASEPDAAWIGWS